MSLVLVIYATFNRQLRRGNNSRWCLIIYIKVFIQHYNVRIVIRFAVVDIHTYILMCTRNIYAQQSVVDCSFK